MLKVIEFIIRHIINHRGFYSVALLLVVLGGILSWLTQEVFTILGYVGVYF